MNTEQQRERRTLLLLCCAKSTPSLPRRLRMKSSADGTGTPFDVLDWSGVHYSITDLGVRGVHVFTGGQTFTHQTAPQHRTALLISRAFHSGGALHQAHVEGLRRTQVRTNGARLLGSSAAWRCAPRRTQQLGKRGMPDLDGGFVNLKTCQRK